MNYITLAAAAQNLKVGVGIVLLIFLIVIIGVVLKFAGVWVRAFMAGAGVSLFQLVRMTLIRIPPLLIVDARISLIKAGLSVPVNDMESHYLAGGDVTNVARALIAADKANIELSFERAQAIDLAGRDVEEAVRTSVQPKVINCPGENQSNTGMLDAVAKDGIRLLVKARVTVRANLERLVGGAGEETIIARVGQGIVSAIGSAPSYKDVLENPDKISLKVLNSGLDSQTGFEIVSIDIADISVAGVSAVSNVGAQLETERAEADKKMRQAEAEGRRAMAVAFEQEMRARVQEMRAKVQEMQAKVTEAKAEVPKAIADAFRKGNLGIMDYYRLNNIESDTEMRKSIAGTDDNQEDN
ncbi:MAG: flotillin-like protein FloA [Kiritimatiellae bacterium]|jgi:uncharacterized protein YqfA (UPF0365 family)|nr:flotillin-like protein FloA [Kiritimatiellia bacterium]